MKDLAIRLTGQIQESNFDEWKTDLIKQIKSANKPLVKDEDFAEAEGTVKSFKDAEKSLVEAKESALEQAADIQKLFGAIDEISEEARQARLSLERQIKQRKEEIKTKIIDSGCERVEKFIDSQSNDYRLAFPSAYSVRDRFADAVKGKKTVKSMNAAVSAVYDEISAEIEEAASRVTAARTTLDCIAEDHKTLFQDERALLAMEPELLQATIDKRIATHEAQEAKRKADEAEAKRLAEEQHNADSASIPQTGQTTQEPPTSADAQAENVSQTPTGGGGLDNQYFQVSVLINADVESAKAIATEINDRYGNRDEVVQIKLARSQEAA